MRLCGRRPLFSQSCSYAARHVGPRYAGVARFRLGSLFRDDSHSIPYTTVPAPAETVRRFGACSQDADAATWAVTSCPNELLLLAAIRGAHPHGCMAPPAQRRDVAVCCKDQQQGLDYPAWQSPNLDGEHRDA